LGMRGKVPGQQTLVLLGSVEDRIPAKHPLRKIKKVTDTVLSRMGTTFESMYSKVGRPSIPPERLLKAQLLIALYSIRSDRQFCEQLEYNLLYRWFLDMNLDEPVFDASTFSHNRERLIAHEVATQLLGEAVREAKRWDLISKEHFSVDGTLIKSWSSMKSFRPKDEPPEDGDSNGWSDFRGTKRSNETHESKTDPDSRLARKGHGQEAKLAYCGNALMENRNGLLLDIDIAQATGRAEREGAIRMLKRLKTGSKRKTVGADKGYDTKDFVADCRELEVTPHVAQNVYGHRRSAIDGRTTWRAGYRASQVCRRGIEKAFGWLKCVAGWDRTRFRGLAKVSLGATLEAAAFNLSRIGRLTAPSVT
jgi:transposase